MMLDDVLRLERHVCVYALHIASMRSVAYEV